MAQVAAVYTIDRFGLGLPAGVAGEVADDVAGLAHKRVWASLVHEAHEVVGEAPVLLGELDELLLELTSAELVIGTDVPGAVSARRLRRVIVAAEKQHERARRMGR